MSERSSAETDELSIKRVGESRLQFVSEYLRVRVDEIEFPSGLTGSYTYIDDNFSAGAAVPMDRRRGQRSVLLVRQERYPSQSIGWEVAAGASSEGESPLEAAQRELAEEGGIEAGLWQPLPRISQLPGRGNTRSDSFLAADITEVESAVESDEVIVDRGWFTMSEVDDLIISGEINSGHTLAALLLARTFLNRYPEHPISVMTSSTAPK